jgi:hypothetical protein
MLTEAAVSSLLLNNIGYSMRVVPYYCRKASLAYVPVCTGRLKETDRGSPRGGADPSRKKNSFGGSLQSVGRHKSF